MPEGKAKFIEDAARVIDGRVEALRAEYDRDSNRTPPPSFLASDNAAILEAELLAKMIRRLSQGPYKGDPYFVARSRKNTPDKERSDVG